MLTILSDGRRQSWDLVFPMFGTVHRFISCKNFLYMKFRRLVSVPQVL